MKTTTTTKTNSSLTKRIKEDMCAVIRIGRLANALAFAKRAHRDAVIHPTSVRKRQTQQATYLLCGYLHAARLLVNDLTPRYGLTPEFSDLILFNAMTGQYRELLAEFDCSPSFHQESSPHRDIELLEIQLFDTNSLSAACHSSSDINYLHYPSITAFDLTTCIWNLKQEFNREQFFEFLRVQMLFLTERFLTAANHFIDETTQKIEKAKA